LNSPIHFEYEITPEVYAACQLLYYRLSGGRGRVRGAVARIFTGLLLIFIAWNERFADLAQILLAAIGVWWTYSGVVRLFPERYFRRAYRKTDFANKKFEADLSETGFEVTGDRYSWSVQWPGVQLRGENDKAFMLCSQGTIFMFGKKYMSTEQQALLRKLSGMTAAGDGSFQSAG
jgi:hypothetical protein